jgi:hypothetical protein
MSKSSGTLQNLQSDLWTASCQIRALGEMLMSLDREPAFDEQDVWHGYGLLIRVIGERMEAWAKILDAENVKNSAKRRSRD